MAIDIGKVDFSSAGVVGYKSLGDSQLTNFRFGRQGDLIVSQQYGMYGDLAMRGMVYLARVGTAAAIPVNTALTNAPTLWNTASSGKMVIPLKILLSPVAIGTPVLQGFTLSALSNAGDAIGTGAPVVTFTNQAPVSSLYGRGGSAITKFAPAVCTFTTNPTAIYDLGVGHWLEGTAASGGPFSLSYEFDSCLLLPPGTTLSIGSTTATSTTYTTTFIFAEIPMPQMT